MGKKEITQRRCIKGQKGGGGEVTKRELKPFNGNVGGSERTGDMANTM
jgi:hypothetical protein